MQGSTCDGLRRHLMERSVTGHAFERVGAIQPERDRSGAIIESRPAPHESLHKYGKGPLTGYYLPSIARAVDSRLRWDDGRGGVNDGNGRLLRLGVPHVHSNDWGDPGMMGGVLQ